MTNGFELAESNEGTCLLASARRVLARSLILGSLLVSLVSRVALGTDAPKPDAPSAQEEKGEALADDPRTNAPDDAQTDKAESDDGGPHEMR